MDWTGNSRSVFSPMGASSHVSEERANNDFYETDPHSLEALLATGISLQHNIWEPACGAGALSKVLEQNGYDVVSTDLIDRGYGISGVNFLLENTTWDGDILTNPPYAMAQQFVEHSLQLVQEHSKVIMFLKLTFLEGQSRKNLFSINPPKEVFVFSQRQMCAKNGIWEGTKSSAVAYAWFIWEKGFTGEPVIKWL